MDKPKDILTTGDVARLCKVAPRTVSKWFDSGRLRGYRIPGSRDRRIPLQQLVRFMKVHGIPLDGIETGRPRILVVDSEPEMTSLIQRALSESGYYDVQTAGSAYEAGIMTERFKPHLLLVDIDVPGLDGRNLQLYISSHPELAGLQVIGMGASLTLSDRQNLIQRGFANAVAKPFDLRQLNNTIESTLNVFV